MDNQTHIGDFKYDFSILPIWLLAFSNFQSSNVPFASGAYADVFLCGWFGQKVVLKQIRINAQSDQVRFVKPKRLIKCKET